MGTNNTFSSNSNTESTKSEIFFEQTKLYHSHLSGNRIGSIVTTFVVAVIFFRIVPFAVLISWVIVQIIIAMVRIYVANFYERINHSVLKLRLWVRTNIAMSFISGVSWGLSSILFLTPEPAIYPITLSIILFSTVSATTVPDSSLPWVHYAYSFPVITLLSLSFIISGIPEYQLISVLFLLFYLISIKYNTNIQKVTQESIALRLTNYDLIEKLRVKNLQTEQESLEKSHFLAAASHDLRQPLHALSLLVETLSTPKKDLREQESIENIKNATAMLSDMVNSILDISKIDLGSVTPNWIEFPIQQVLNHIAWDAKSGADEKGLELNIQDSDLYVRSDRSMLERILRNLVSNAIRYTDSGHVNVKLSALGDFVTITVEDSGIGISDVDLEHIFDSFFQVYKINSSVNQGSGLGLTIVDKLCKLLDIKLTVESHLGSGTEFRISIPISSTKGISAEVRKPIVSGNENFSGVSILVVDDEVMVQNAMKSVLVGWSCEVVTAGSTDQALNKIQGTGITPDILVIDYHLENDLIGLDELLKLRSSLGRDIPALLITADTSINIVTDIIDVYVLHKPLVIEQFTGMLNFALANQRHNL